MTTDVLGDVVASAVGDAAAVEVIMPRGADPHDFAPSARQSEAMEGADLLIVNGAGFEEGMVDVVDAVAAGGTQVFTVADQVDLITDDDPDHGDGGDEDDDDHDHGGADPHLWTDPERVATALAALEPVVAGLDGVDAVVLGAAIDVYVRELAALVDDMGETLAVVEEDRRVLVTNHEVFAYFAERFDFEVVGAIVPSLTTSAEPSAAEVEELAGVIEQRSIPAIFAETTRATRLADALAAEVGGGVEVVELFSESLGEPGSGAETYLRMMRRNAELVAGALS
ncbi:metal ABC transporter solute-binding protein, Zn/Mn family [Ilumatobacter sp.]|uniref:metal ABC transporter solute-binding protein, Zn/Mn family n=1 Tax=Ilumatobacter sp. TaxID=1967498 RepID=UPI003B528B4A